MNWASFVLQLNKLVTMTPVASVVILVALALDIVLANKTFAPVPSLAGLIYNVSLDNGRGGMFALALAFALSFAFALALALLALLRVLRLDAGGHVHSLSVLGFDTKSYFDFRHSQLSWAFFRQHHRGDGMQNYRYEIKLPGWK